jgi:hypothetical protein
MPTKAEWEAVKTLFLIVAVAFLWLLPSGSVTKLWRTWNGKKEKKS